MQRPIFLIGYMGCGKTTLGKALARELGLRFIDLDDYIEQVERRSVSAIFAAEGEAYFRRVERESLINASRQATASVIATGGGTACSDEAMTLMGERGVSVWLRPSRERLLRRLLLPEQRAKRPLLAGKSDDEIATFIDKALPLREPFYSQATVTFDSSLLESPEEIRHSARRLAAVIRAL